MDQSGIDEGPSFQVAEARKFPPLAGRQNLDFRRRRNRQGCLCVVICAGRTVWGGASLFPFPAARRRLCTL